MRLLALFSLGLTCSACMPIDAFAPIHTSPLPSVNNSPNAPFLHKVADTSKVIALSPSVEPPTMQGMLEAHNQVRAAVGAVPLLWSSKMSRYAQDWANYLAANNQCTMQHRSAAGADYLPVGENLFWASPENWSDGHTNIQAITPSQVALDWASEKPDYHYDSNSCDVGKKCGHYTQMVWASSLEMGCGMTICPDKGQIWVCNYNPAGNWVGEKPY